MSEQKLQTELQTEKIYQFHAGIRWSSVFGGWLFAYAFAMLLYLLGAAITGNSFLIFADGFKQQITFSSTLWVVLSSMVAIFAGSMLSGRSAGVMDRGTAVIHGLLVWALAGVMTLLVAAIQAATATQSQILSVQTAIPVTGTSTTLWALFFTSLLGLGAGALGGMLGNVLSRRAFSIDATIFKSGLSYEEDENKRDIA